MKGKENPTSEFDLLEIVEKSRRSSRSPIRRITRMFAGGDALGECNNGA